MASGHKKRIAALVRLEVLDPAGLTNVVEQDRGIVARQNNLVNLAVYSTGAYSPTFLNGSTTKLSDAVSNADGVYSLITNAATPYQGETFSALASNISRALYNQGMGTASWPDNGIGVEDGAKHYMFSRTGTAIDLSSSAVTGPFIIYSADGPQAQYSGYLRNASTRRIFLSNQVTGAGNPTHVSIFIGGQLPTGDSITIANRAGTTLNARVSTRQGGSNAFASLITQGATASASDFPSGSYYAKGFIIPTSSFNTGIYIAYDTTSTSTALTKGFFIAISSGSYLTSGVPVP